MKEYADGQPLTISENPFSNAESVVTKTQNIIIKGSFSDFQTTPIMESKILVKDLKSSAIHQS